MIFGTLLLACGAHTPRQGVVAHHEDRTVLVEQSGRMLRLQAVGEASAVHALHGCTVELVGPVFGRKMWVQKWTVEDAGFGSAPFVGTLRRYGANWLLDDRTTGSTMVLEHGTIGGLTQHDGDLVLIEGLVMGPHQVRVMSWRVLREATGEAKEPG